MKVSVNLPNLPQGEMVEVAHPFEDSTNSKSRMVLHLGEVPNGSVTEIDDAWVQGFGGIPVDIRVGEELHPETPVEEAAEQPQEVPVVEAPATVIPPTTEGTN